MSDPDIVTRLRAVLHNDRSVELMNREAADEIERLRKERDEARRDWCRLWARTDGRNLAPTQAARLREWGCFKEER
jgi:hypothetical protein